MGLPLNVAKDADQKTYTFVNHVAPPPSSGRDHKELVPSSAAKEDFDNGTVMQKWSCHVGILQESPNNKVSIRMFIYNNFKTIIKGQV